MGHDSSFSDLVTQALHKQTSEQKLTNYLLCNSYADDVNEINREQKHCFTKNL